MVKNRYYQLVIMVVCLLSLSSCASNYVGRSVKMNHKSVCNFQIFPASCSSSDQEFVYSYRIEQTGNPNEYKISGTAQYVGGQTFTSFSGMSLTLLLVRSGYVAETFGISGGSGSLESTITFSRTFVTPIEFDASLIGCTGGQARG